MRLVPINRVLGCIAAWVSISCAVLAQEDPKALLDAARAAIVEHRLADAKRLLGAISDKTAVDLNDLDFLEGTLAEAEGDHAAAIEHFRAILTRDPSVVRVRLDLARALFNDGDDSAAAYHFRMAIADGLPPEVEANAQKYLAAIRRRKDWDVSVSAGVAPDTNINAATVVKTVQLYGLPFQLDQNAQKKSGVGFDGALSGDVQADLTDDSRLILGGFGRDLDYEGKLYDDRSAGVYLGPRFILSDQSEITVKAEASRRWYGGRPYSASGGGRIEAETILSSRWSLDGSIDVQRVTYDQLPVNTGMVYSASVGGTYGVDSESFVRLDLSYVREQTSYAPFRDSQYGLAASYYRDLPWGFGGLVGIGGVIAPYDAHDPVFDETRRDDVFYCRFGLSNKYLNVWGFTPVVNFTHTKRFSNVDLYQFERDRAELAITRNF